MGVIRVPRGSWRGIAAALLVAAICARDVHPVTAAVVRPPVPQLPVIKVMGILISETLEVLVGWGFIARLHA